MKALLIFFISSFFTLMFNNEKLDKCNGVENFIFGTPKSQFKNITLEIEEGTAQLYTADAEALKITGVQFDYIGVSFIKNKLSAVSMSTKNSTGGAFFNYLKGNFGTPKKTKNQFEWQGKSITIVFLLSKNNKDASIDFYSK